MSHHTFKGRILLILIILLVGCSSSSQRWGVPIWSPPIDGLRWGISKDKAISALRLKESDFNMYDEGGISILAVSKSLQVYGKAAQVELAFDDQDLGLFKIRAKFASNDVDAVAKAMNDTYGAGANVFVSGMDNSYREWKGPLLSAVNEDGKNAISAFYDSRSIDKRLPEDSPVCQFRLNDGVTHPQYGEAEFSGTGAALLGILDSK